MCVCVRIYHNLYPCCLIRIYFIDSTIYFYSYYVTKNIFELQGVSFHGWRIGTYTKLCWVFVMLSKNYYHFSYLCISRYRLSNFPRRSLGRHDGRASVGASGRRLKFKQDRKNPLEFRCDFDQDLLSSNKKRRPPPIWKKKLYTVFLL